MVNLGYGFFGGKNITGGGVGKSYNYQRRSMDVVAFTVGNIRFIFTRYINNILCSCVYLRSLTMIRYLSIMFLKGKVIWQAI